MPPLATAVPQVATHTPAPPPAPPPPPPAMPLLSQTVRPRDPIAPITNAADRMFIASLPRVARAATTATKGRFVAYKTPRAASPPLVSVGCPRASRARVRGVAGEPRA